MYYSYNPYFQLSEKETITSLGTYKDVCLYPSDKNDNLYKQMTDANIVGIPIESQSYLNEKIISANKTEYGKQGNTYVPFAQYKAEMNTPIDVSVLKNAYVKGKIWGIIHLMEIQGKSKRIIPPPFLYGRIWECIQ